MADYFGESHEASEMLVHQFHAAVPPTLKPLPFSLDGKDTLPKNFVWTSGMGPAAIDDPQLRAAYEQALSWWRADEERKSEMVWLIRDYAEFGRAMESGIINLYGFHPFNQKELAGLILKRVANPELRAKLGQRLNLSNSFFPLPKESSQPTPDRKHKSNGGFLRNDNPVAFWFRPPPVAGVLPIESAGATTSWSLPMTGLNYGNGSASSRSDQFSLLILDKRDSETNPGEASSRKLAYFFPNRCIRSSRDLVVVHQPFTL